MLHSEIRTLGHPRAALLGFATAVLAYNVLSCSSAASSRPIASRCPSSMSRPTTWRSMS